LHAPAGDCARRVQQQLRSRRAIVGVAAYSAIAAGRPPQLAKMAAAAERHRRLTSGQLSLLLLLLMTGAWFTDAIGVHAVFGAFLMGVAMPRGFVAEELSRVIEPLATTLLVPLFFAYSGLSTRFALLWSAELVALSGVVIAIASIGKGVACWAAARLTGRPNGEAMALGALMNARGLMELIILISVSSGG
jgi:Kef-type K+ transport system membrane component KefB